MKARTKISTGTVATIALALLGGCTTALQRQMNGLQSSSNDLGRSIQRQDNGGVQVATNGMSQTIETIKAETPTYKQFNLANDVPYALTPPLQTIPAQAKAGDWASARTSYIGMIDSCNRCHVTTGNPQVKAKSVFE